MIDITHRYFSKSNKNSILLYVLISDIVEKWISQTDLFWCSYRNITFGENIFFNEVVDTSDMVRVTVNTTRMKCHHLLVHDNK